MPLDDIPLLAILELLVLLCIGETQLLADDVSTDHDRPSDKVVI